MQLNLQEINALLMAVTAIGQVVGVTVDTVKNIIRAIWGDKKTDAELDAILTQVSTDARFRAALAHAEAGN